MIRRTTSTAGTGSPSTPAGAPTDPHWRGDFKGLIGQLDYLKDLGFTAIWITPPIENRSGLDYHGYHGYDWTRIDPRLESPDATYQHLIDAAHERGIKIIQDIVVNDSCQYGIRGKVWIDHLPIKYYVPQGSQQGEVENGPYQGNLGNYAWPNRDDLDNPVAPQWYRERHERDPEGREPLIDPRTGQAVPEPGYDPGRFFGVDATGSTRSGTTRTVSSRAATGKAHIRCSTSTSQATASTWRPSTDASRTT